MSETEYQRHLDDVVREAENRNARAARDAETLDRLRQSLVMGTHQIRALTAIVDYYDDARAELARKPRPHDPNVEPFPKVMQQGQRRVA